MYIYIRPVHLSNVNVRRNSLEKFTWEIYLENHSELLRGAPPLVSHYLVNPPLGYQRCLSPRLAQ